jgi:hypothetical protein
MEKDALIVYGAVPDSVGGASVTRADGSAVNARLVRNSFVLETTKHASRPVAVRLSIGDAAITRDALVPADASRSECEGEGRRR